jgi:hypothetical protein
MDPDGAAMRLAPLIALLLLAGCRALKDESPQDSGDADDTGSGAATTVEALCGAVFALCADAWGWPDEQACIDGWLGLGEDWECADPHGYLACALDCPQAADCATFGACETPCWDQHCL